jgi:fructan beta-fructosidase
MTAMARPAIHFTPESGWLNDPNGLVYYEGEYHLFYQYVPDIGGAGAAKSWGHAVSCDLVSWEDLQVALVPDELGAIWSGSAVVDTHDSSGFLDGGSGLVALFTHWRAGVQAQSLAYSRDRGRTWTKYAANPVIAAPDLPVFRDPKVIWHAPAARWMMVVTVGQRARFYASADLRVWRVTGEFGAGHGSQAGVWECPDLFPVPVEGTDNAGRWVLLVSLNGPEGSWMEYFVGDFDGATFTSADPAGTVLPFDRGRDYYAAISWSDVPPEDGRRLTIGWLNNWRYARELPTSPWRGALTLPRALTLRQTLAGPRIIQRPVAELQQLRGPAHRWDAQKLTPGAPLALPGVDTALEVLLTVGVGEGSAFRIAFGTFVEGGIVLDYDAASGLLAVERGAPDGLPTFGGRHEVPLAPDAGLLTLHLFIDRCSLELFADDGAVALTELFFSPASDLPVTLTAVGGVVELVSLTAYPLRAVARAADAG